MSIDWQQYVDQAQEMAECYGRPVTIGLEPATTPVQFCSYKEKKWNKWLTLKSWDKVCIPAKNLTLPVVRGTIIVDPATGVDWYVLDPGLCMPGPVLTEYCAKVCENKFVHTILISDREIVPPDDGSVDFNMDFPSEGQIVVNAMTETLRGEDNFNNSGQTIDATHRFTIPWSEGITSEQFIVFGPDLYRVLDVENLNGDDQFWSILASIRGTVFQQVNLS